MSESDYWDSIARKRIEFGGEIETLRRREWEQDDPEVVFQDILNDYARDADVILDIGCGKGLLGGNMTTGASLIVGTDLSLAALEHAASLSSECGPYYIQSNARVLPFPCETFNLICVKQMPLATDPAALIETKRVMKPGGTLLALVTGETHRIETQEVFGRGANWPPVKPIRFDIPQKLSNLGLEMTIFAEYFASTYYPDINLFAAELETLSIIPRFDRERDALFLREIERKLKTDGEIKDTEHMAIFGAWKEL